MRMQNTETWLGNQRSLVGRIKDRIRQRFVEIKKKLASSLRNKVLRRLGEHFNSKVYLLSMSEDERYLPTEKFICHISARNIRQRDSSCA